MSNKPGWGTAIGNITEWIRKGFQRRDEKNEKDAGKAIMSGDESKLNRLLKRLYPKKK